MKPLQKSRLRRYFDRLSMRQKMWFSFSLPTFAVTVLVLVITFFSFQGSYRQRLMTSAGQDNLQTCRLIESYMNSMTFISEQVSRSSVIHDVLETSDFGAAKSGRESFIEYLALSEMISELEIENMGLRIGLYLPDEIAYTNNQLNFYPLSQLTNRADYEEIVSEMNKLGCCFRFLDEQVNFGNARRSVPYFCRLAPLVIVNEDGVRNEYIIKVEMEKEVLTRAMENTTLLGGSLVLLVDQMNEVFCTSDDERYSPLLPDIVKALEAGNWEAVDLYGVRYLVVGSALELNNWRLVSFIPESSFNAQMEFIFFMIALALVCIILTVSAVSTVLSRYYVGRIDLLNGRMQNVTEGQVNSRMGEEAYGEGRGDEMDELYRNFDYMTDEVRRLLKEEYELGGSITRAEMRALQAQINPHFLYNTLDIINWGAMDHGAEDVARIARDLGLYYRLTLNRGSSVITLADEIRHVEAFIRIENVHYDNAIDFRFDLPEELSRYACLNAILQPIVENSIVHGIAEHADIDRTSIYIGVTRVKDDIQISVTDDGPGMSAEKAAAITVYNPGAKGHGYGIANTNFRLQLCYGEQYGITYHPAQPHGTVAVVRIRAMMPNELEKLVNG